MTTMCNTNYYYNNNNYSLSDTQNPPKETGMERGMESARARELLRELAAARSDAHYKQDRGHADPAQGAACPSHRY